MNKDRMVVASLALNAITLAVVMLVAAQLSAAPVDLDYLSSDLASIQTDLSSDLASIQTEITSMKSDLQSLNEGVTVRETPGTGLFGGLSYKSDSERLASIEDSLARLESDLNRVCSAVQGLDTSPYFGVPC